MLFHRRPAWITSAEDFASKDSLCRMMNVPDAMSERNVTYAARTGIRHLYLHSQRWPAHTGSCFYFGIFVCHVALDLTRINVISCRPPRPPLLYLSLTPWMPLQAAARVQWTACVSYVRASTGPWPQPTCWAGAARGGRRYCGRCSAWWTSTQPGLTCASPDSVWL